MHLRIPISRSFHLALLAITCAGLLPSHAWRSALYPENWTPPESASFTTDKLIQDFSYAGYRRGEEPIPDIAGPVFDAVATYGADPTGANDSTSEIQAAINAAAAAGGGVVFLPAGTYRVAPIGANNFALRIQNSNIVLRGAGVGETFLLNTSHEMRSKAVIRIAPSSTSLGTTVNLSSDPANAVLDKPTRRIPVANASAFQTGDIVRMEWTFTQDWIDEHSQGNWWSEGSAPAPAQYLREVTAVNPAEGWIEIDVPTRYTMKVRDNASVRTISGQLSGVGIEGFSIANIQHPGSGFGENDYTIEGTAAWDAHASWLVRMQDVIDCWITGVHSYEPDGNTSTCHMLSNGILLLRTFRVTVANCEMRRSQYGGGGGNGYMFRVQHSHDNLIQDSIADFSRHGLVLSHAGTSGNVFLRCEDRETKLSTGSTGSYTTSGSGSDHHMHFSHSNLFDMCHAHNSFYTAHHRGNSGTTPHGLTSAHGVYWNTSGSGTRGGAIVRSEQARYGYVIGTSGERSAVTNPTGGNTAPADHVEGVGMGATMAVPSLYLDQLAKRMQGFLVSAGNNAVTESTPAYPLAGSIFTYGSDPVSSLWTQISGPATAVFADASSPTTTVALPEVGTYVLELSATDGSNNASAQVVIEVKISTPRSAAHFIRGESQNEATQPLGYFTTAGDLIGTQGSSGSREDRNVVLGYTLPTLPEGTTLESATLGFEITQGRDTTGDVNLPELHVYLLDSVNPTGSELAFFYHGPLDNSPDVKRVGTTSVTITGTDNNDFTAGEQVRFFTLTGDALALLRGFYDGHLPTRSTVYFRFNLSEDPSMNDFRRYRVNTAAAGSSLYLKPNAIPSVNAGPDQTVLLTGSLPWTPALIPTLAWYDAADAATITQSAGAVSQWADKSGNHRNASQGTSARRPSYLASDPLLNQLPSIGNGSASGSIGLVTPTMAAQTVYVVTYYKDGLDTSFDDYPTLFSGPGTHGEFRVMGNLNTPSFIATHRFNDAGTFANGATGSTDTVLPMGASVLKFKSSTARSQTYHLGFNSKSNTRDWQGNYSEWIFTDGSENADDEKAIEGYLAHKWGLTAKLPADHPYKTIAPSAPSTLSTLGGSASDPENDPLTYAWSLVSGPGPVVFSNASSLETDVFFQVAGDYTLRLTVSDGFSTNFDDVVITVQAPATYTVSYDGNEATGGTAPSNQTKTQDEDLTLATNSGGLVRSGHVFLGWNTSADGSGIDYPEGATYSDNAPLALFAKWNANPSVSAGQDQTVTLDQPVPWTPAQLTTAAWYDAADPSTLTIESGNAVSEWRDKSGNGNHASQATPSRMPATGVANIGGLNAISFDPFNDQHLAADDHASLNLDASGGANVFAVFNYTGYVDRGSGLNSIVSKGQLLSAGAAYGIRLNTNNRLPFKAGDGLTCTPTDAPVSQDLIYSGTRNDAAMTATAYLNGIQRAAASAAAISSDNNSALVLGGELATSRCADVRLGEVLIVPGLITADDRQKTEGYLAHKWGMAGDLPADHPYKDAAPVVPDAFAIAALDGSATDPENDPLTFSWSVVSGPGDVVFADPTAPDTTATFSKAGTYVLRLTVSDGISTNSDEVTITVEAPAVEPKTYDVYLIAGQSNADGRGFTSDLTGGLAAYADTQENVKLYYVNPANSDPDNPTHNTGWTSLAPGYSVAPGFSSALPSDRFGFEVSLGKALADHDPERNVAIIKVSRGGTSLHTDWDPAGGANYMWQTFANKVPEAMAALTAGGDIAEIRGMFWHQGESDGSNPTYQSDLVEFIAACRTLTGKPGLPFAIGELERDDVTPTVRGRSYQLTAMANVADADPDTIVVSSADLLTYDGTHFTSEAYITFGERFATALHDFKQGLNHSVTYDGNSSTGGDVPVDSRSYNSIASATVLGAGDLEKSGFIFSGWNTAADGGGTAYPPGSVFVITADTTLHAQWTPKITPTVDPWPVASTITEGQPLSSATLSGGGASVPGTFAFTNPAIAPPAGIYVADVTFIPDETATYNTVQGTVNVNVLTPFESWAGDDNITFSNDANGDGVADGLAWLLGAGDPTPNARALLPTAIVNNGMLEASFTMLNQASRGAAMLNLQFGTDLGAWTTVTIPEASGTQDGVHFIITPNGGLNQVIATIPDSAAADGKLFLRLSGSEN